MSRKTRLVLVVGLIVLLSAASAAMGCGSDGTSSSSETSAPAQTTAPSSATTAPAAVSSTAGPDTTASGVDVAVSEWDISFLTVTTGPGAFWGLSGQLGLELAAAAINDAGGIEGVPLKPVIYDTGFDPGKAVASMTEILGKNGLLVVGPLGGHESVALAPLAAENEVFLLTPAGLFEQMKQYAPWNAVIGVDFGPAATGAIKEWLAQNPDIKSVVNLTQTEDPSAGFILEGAAAAYEAMGVEVAETIEVPSDTVDLAPIAVRVMGDKPDGLFVNISPDLAPRLMIELNKLGWADNSKIIGSAGINGGPLFEQGKGYIDGMYIWADSNLLSDNPAWLAAVKANQEEFDVPEGIYPSPPLVVYYDMTLLIAKCFEDLGITGSKDKVQDERVAIRDYLRNIEGFQGVNDTFDVVDGRLIKPIYLFQIQNNELSSGTPVNWYE